MPARKKTAAKPTRTPVPPAPGSRNYVDPMGAVPAHYSTEDIAERQAAAAAAGLEPSGVKVIKDKWYGDISTGDPFAPYAEAAKPFIDGNPDKHFRFLSDRQVKHRGRRGYILATDPETRKGVEVGGQPLAFISQEAHAARQRDVVEKSEAAIAAAEEEYYEAEARAVHESEGALLPYRSGQVVGGKPMGVTSRRGQRLST